MSQVKIGMLSVNIAGLKEGLHEFSLRPSPADIDVDPEVFSGVLVDVTLDRQVDKVLVSFDASATARLQCDRTLVNFDEPVSGHFEVLFAPPEMVETREEGDESIQPLYPDDEEVDITSFVRDTLMLSIPQRKVAPGAEHVDLQTRFGGTETETTDPRWAALRELRDDPDKSSY